MFLREHMSIKVGDPELTFLGNAQIIQSVFDVRFDLAPEKPGIGRCRSSGLRNPSFSLMPVSRNSANSDGILRK
jgi:hypothetical protein